MEINGLPLHPLVVHAAVVFGPLAALSALVYVCVPPWRERARWPMIVLTFVAITTILVAYFSGNNFLDSRPELRASPQVEKHEDWAGQLLWVTIGFGVIALASGWVNARRGALRVVLDALLVVGAIALISWVAITGEAGARAVWG